MNRLLKLVGITLGFLSFLAGCGSGVGGKAYADYGVFVPPKPHDKTVTLDGFSYSPPSPVHPGDTLEFTVTTNKPTDTAWLSVDVGDPPEYTIYLSDRGGGFDDVANDGIWHGGLELPADAEPVQDLPTTARLRWYDGAEPLELAGDDLTIEEGE